MNRITIKASRQYDVIVGNDLLANAKKWIPLNRNCKNIVIISDSNVWPLYGKAVMNALNKDGLNILSYIFSAGEASKSPQVYLEILNFLAYNRVSRSDMLIALGGGVVGDMTGFVAATYLRGVPYIQIPTTLLAMVDSSVGGKTAIDLPAGKNLVGAFYQPELVICDIDVLDTLDKETFRDGCAEVIKYAILYDSVLFDHLMQNNYRFQREYVISKCIELKRDVVALDEFDTGIRQFLNLGHTFGHAIEAEMHFQITHGQAVAIGIAIVSKASVQYGLCDNRTCEQIFHILNAFSLPTRTDIAAERIASLVLNDKKRFGEHIHLIVPRQIGSCSILPIKTNEINAYIEAGLSLWI